MSNTKYAFSFASLTDVGLVRQLNEDRELILNINQDAKAFIVCDGMGGHDSGDKASEAAVRFISEFLQTKPIDNATISLVNAIKFANQQIYFESKVSPTSKGMGTTAVVLLQFQDEILVGHVGDSRAYRFTDNQLTQITKDHSVVQEMVNQGLISQIQAEHHPRKNEITKALGIRENEEPTVSNNIKAVKGDRFILCSDGLSGLISHEAFTDAVRKHSDPNVCAMKLVQMAKNGGGHDNITVQVIDVIESPNKAQRTSKSKQTIMLASAAAISGILVIAFATVIAPNLINELKEETATKADKTIQKVSKTISNISDNNSIWITKDSLKKAINFTSISRRSEYQDYLSKKKYKKLIEFNVIEKADTSKELFVLHKTLAKKIKTQQSQNQQNTTARSNRQTTRGSINTHSVNGSNQNNRPKPDTVKKNTTTVKANIITKPDTAKSNIIPRSRNNPTSPRPRTSPNNPRIPRPRNSSGTNTSSTGNSSSQGSNTNN